MSEGWQRARLIPTSGIAGSDEAERRATSALLSVLGAVREFGTAVLRPFGAPAGTLDAFIEVPFKLVDATVIPDGLVRVTRGTKTWTTLVEVKTGGAELGREQVEAYLDVAREQGFDAVVTISNQLSSVGLHPVEVDKRKLRKVVLHHLSWAEILTIAVQQRVHRGVSDPEQAWILGELIRCLEHPKSGALDFSDMGSEWVTIREAVAAGTLRASDKGLGAVVARWDQLLRFAALRLGRELGADVQVMLSRKESADPTGRLASHSESLVREGILVGTIRIPDAIAPLDVVADVRGGRVTVSVHLAAPKEGRETTKVSWLTRQLKDAPGGLRIDAWATGQRTSASELLDVVREDSAVLVSDPRRSLREFRVAAVSAMGTKRGTGRGSFIDSVLAAIEGFYGSVLQQLRPWSARAPKLPPVKSAVEEAGIDTTSDEPPVAETEPDEADSATMVVTPLPEPAPEVVSWELAQERLERERHAHPDTSDDDPDTEGSDTDRWGGART